MEGPLSRLPTESLPTHINGMNRPNGLNKALALPLAISQDFEDTSFKDDPSKKRSG